MAIIQLKKVLSMNPKMVQGHQLLGLLYLEEGNYEQAAKALEKAHAIDTNNTTTLRYMKELDDRAKASGTTLKDKNKKTVSYQSGNAPWQTECSAAAFFTRPPNRQQQKPSA